MYIREAPESFRDPGYKETIKRFVATAGRPLLRPCEACTLPGSAGAYCSRPCAHAAQALSSDPERYPIEPNVLPLVFSLTRLNCLKPCWSCEGHNDPGGKLWKLPQVWFYTCYPCYAHLVGKFLWEMKTAKLLSYEWRVSVSAFGDPGCATYIIEPARLPDDAELRKLQLDLEVMGRCCEAGITAVAYRILLE
jgi:hypothetical protein